MGIMSENLSQFKNFFTGKKEKGEVEDPVAKRVHDARGPVDDWAERPMNDSHRDKLLEIDGGWMLRKCAHYHEELKVCRSIHNRFHHYYVHGEFQDCTQWKENFNDCKKWSESADEEAAKRVVERERARIAERLKAHFSNDVWERRTAPPDDWNKPLPDHLADAAEDSLLRVYRGITIRYPQHINGKCITRPWPPAGARYCEE